MTHQSAGPKTDKAVAVIFHPSGSAYFQMTPFKPTNTAIEHQPAITLIGVRTSHFSKVAIKIKN